MKPILYIAAIVGLATYLFWVYMPNNFFYYGNAILIFLLCLYIYLKDKSSFIGFFLVCVAINNLIDEIFSNNTKLSLQELSLIIVIPLIWFFKTREK